MSFIELKDVSKGYGTGARRIDVLQNVNLSVSEGEFVSVVGYSGSGKTTLISMIAGLLSPDSGQILVDGEPVSGPSSERALIFQNYSLLPWLTVFGNVKLAVDQVYREWPAARRRAEVEKFIGMVKLREARDKYPCELSGGMRQRVAVARALAVGPRVLLLDEPLSALDALTRAGLQDEISEIWQRNRTTVLWITNDPDEAILVADRVIPLTRGPQATLGPPLAIELPRPRDRRSINRDAGFIALRNRLVGYLIEQKPKDVTTVSRRLTLPDILPEDVMTRGSMRYFWRRRPLRRSEQKREVVEVIR